MEDRKIEIVENNRKSLVNTKNNFLMEHTLQCVNGKKDGIKLLKNINSVQKCKGVMLPYELMGENGRKLTNCRRISEKRSSLLWKKFADEQC